MSYIVIPPLKPAEIKKTLIASFFSLWLKADRPETRASRWGRKEVEVLKFVLHCTLLQFSVRFLTGFLQHKARLH